MCLEPIIQTKKLKLKLGSRRAALTKHLLLQLPAFTEACYEYHKVHAVVHELTGKSQERFSCYVHLNVFSAVK